MAKLSTDKASVEVKEHESLIKAGEELGVYFACENGDCGACDVEILEGMDNLTTVNDKENDYVLIPGHRLLCQCKIKHGNVKIKF
jgi:ferredoxin